VIVDTDVLIWDLRGHEAARDALSGVAPFNISVVTYIELLQGMRDKAELRALRRQLQRWAVTILHIDGNISTRAMLYVEEYYLSHSVAMADALVAATAVVHHESVMTANERHYRPIPNLPIVSFTP
jgi:predicted nucleic acid-binding protein